MPRHPCLVVAAVCLATALGCFRPVRDAPYDPAYTWTTYHGSPDRNPFADERISEAAPETVWNINAGRGLSAPPVPLGPILVATTTNRMVMAFSSESGFIYWEHRKNGPFVTPPVTDGTLLYLSTSDIRARVYALRVEDGGEEWEKRYPGLSAPMILANDRLYLASEPGLVTALRANDGEEVWSVTLGAPTAAAPVVMDDRLMIATIRDTLYSVGLDDGAIAGRHPVPARVSAAPAVRGSTLYLPMQSGHVAALAGDAVTERWRANVGAPVLASPVAADDGAVYALASDGSVWSVTGDGAARRLADLGSAASGALTIARNAIVVGLLDGRVVALSRDDGRELWTVRLGDSVNTPPVIQDGAIYVPLRRGRVAKLL